ncbi:MAG TPA: hypothetical protein DCO86_01810 [Spirochaetaceae bacterium]|nr:hypothetical protein [Spirochaetaceae bacterium]
MERYKEMASSASGGGGASVPYDIDITITELDIGKIDKDYLNSQFKRYSP